MSQKCDRSLPPEKFSFLCRITNDKSKRSVPGFPMTVNAWRERLLQYQPHVGEGSDDRVLFARKLGAALRTDAEVERFVKYYQSHRDLAAPEVNLRTEREIEKRLYASLKSFSSTSCSCRSSNSSSSSSSTHHRPPHQQPLPATSSLQPSNMSSKLSSKAPSGESNSPFDLRNCTLQEFWARQDAILDRLAELKAEEAKLITELQTMKIFGALKMAERYPMEPAELMELMTLFPTKQNSELQTNSELYNPEESDHE